MLNFFMIHFIYFFFTAFTGMLKVLKNGFPQKLEFFDKRQINYDFLKRVKLIKQNNENFDLEIEL